MRGRGEEVMVCFFQTGKYLYHHNNIQALVARSSRSIELFEDRHLTRPIAPCEALERGRDRITMNARRRAKTASVF
jgi:hypothetical protein